MGQIDDLRCDGHLQVPIGSRLARYGQRVARSEAESQTIQRGETLAKDPFF